MTIEIKVPSLPESVLDATIAKWYKKVGDFIQRDENLVDLETDKVMLEVPAPQAGVIEKIVAQQGETVTAGAILAVINEKATAEKTPAKVVEKKEQSQPAAQQTGEEKPSELAQLDLSPAVRRQLAEHQIDINQIKGTGKNGRITKEDIESYIEQQTEKPELAKKQLAAPSEESAKFIAPASATSTNVQREEKRVPMSRLRAKIAERLVGIQHEAAILTSFNEINMQPVMELRKIYQDRFEKTHGVRLGFMSFFTKAVVEALKRFPVLNASVDGHDIVYHNYFDIGIAVGGGPRGLVVPVIRNADLLSMAQIEKEIREYSEKARTGKLSIEEMSGGTFTITNGGVYGSMLSTPIINPPQSGILGMHKIIDRPVVEDNEIVIRPIMYVALSYDHRIVDGSESVRFLVTVKELLEDPARLLLEI